MQQQRDVQLESHCQVTRDLILALEHLQASANKPKPTEDLAREGYAKLQFDFPMVGAAEVNALADLFQHCLELKMGAGLGPLSKYLVTAKFVDNIVHGAKQPPPLPTPTSAGASHVRTVPSSSPSAPLPASHLTSGNSHAAPEPSLLAADTAAAAVAGDAAAGGASATSLLQAAYQRLCTCVLLRYTAVALRVPEWETWHMLAAYQVKQPETDEEDDGERRGLCKDGGSGPASLEGGWVAVEAEHGGSQKQTQQLSHSDGGISSHGGSAGRVMSDGVEAAEADPDDLEFEPLEEPVCTPSLGNGSLNHPHHLATPGANAGHAFSSAPFPHSPATHAQTPCTNGVSTSAATAGLRGSWSELLRKLHALVSADHLDALMPAAGTGEAAARSSSSNTTATTATITPANRITHPTITPANALSSNGVASKSSSSSSREKVNEDASRGRDDGTGGSSTAAAADVDAWRLSDTGGALMELLRSIGVHAHAAGLHPMLQACVALLGRRLAAHPEEMAAGLQQLWDTLGVCGVASMPPALQGYSTGSTAANGQQQKKHVLAPEANVALTLLADLASCHISSQGRTALWRQINLHTLPVLRRCLEDVAAARRVSPDTLAAVTLVSKVVLFYLEHAPGGFNAPSALLSAGVVRGLAVALPRFGPIPDAPELRTTVLLCTSDSPEVCSWIAAVPGVRATLSGPAFQLGGWGEAHGALWQLLTAAHLQNGAATGAAVGAGKQASGTLTSPSDAAGSQQGPCRGQELLMVALLEAGMGSSSMGQLQRMHAALDLLLRAWQQSRRRRFWGPAVDAALRTALQTLKQAAAAPAASPSLPRASQAATGAQQTEKYQSHENMGMEASNKMLRAKTGTLQEKHKGVHAAINGQPVIEQDRGVLVAGPNAAYTNGVGSGDVMLGGGQEVAIVSEQEGGETAQKGDDKAKEGDDKAHGLDVGALEARSMQRMGGACMKLLKELLMTESKMD